MYIKKITLCLIAVLLSSCGLFKSFETAMVSINLPKASNRAASQVSSYRLTVSAPDIKTFSKDFISTFELEIKAGLERSFTLEGIDLDGIVIFKDTIIKDLNPRDTVSLNFTLKSTDNTLFSFIIDGYEGVQNGNNITITLPYIDTASQVFVKTPEFQLPKGVTSSPASLEQVDFGGQGGVVKYSVTSRSGDVQEYSVTLKYDLPGISDMTISGTATTGMFFEVPGKDLYIIGLKNSVDSATANLSSNGFFNLIGVASDAASINPQPSTADFTNGPVSFDLLDSTNSVVRTIKIAAAIDYASLPVGIENDIPFAPDASFFYFVKSGFNPGPFYGTDNYTNDSCLETSAVHSGALKNGEEGIVRVTTIPSLPDLGGGYVSSTRNGVFSSTKPIFSGSGFLVSALDKYIPPFITIVSGEVQIMNVNTDPATQNIYYTINGNEPTLIANKVTVSSKAIPGLAPGATVKAKISDGTKESVTVSVTIKEVTIDSPLTSVNQKALVFHGASIEPLLGDHNLFFGPAPDRRWKSILGPYKDSGKTMLFDSAMPVFADMTYFYDIKGPSVNSSAVFAVGDLGGNDTAAEFVTYYENSIYIYRDNGDSLNNILDFDFIDIGPNIINHLVIADADGDGDNDIVFAGDNGFNGYFSNNGLYASATDFMLVQASGTFSSNKVVVGDLTTTPVRAIIWAATDHLVFGMASGSSFTDIHEFATDNNKTITDIAINNIGDNTENEIFVSRVYNNGTNGEIAFYSSISLPGLGGVSATYNQMFDAGSIGSPTPNLNPGKILVYNFDTSDTDPEIAYSELSSDSVYYFDPSLTGAARWVSINSPGTTSLSRYTSGSTEKLVLGGASGTKYIVYPFTNPENLIDSNPSVSSITARIGTVPVDAVVYVIGQTLEINTLP